MLTITIVYVCLGIILGAIGGFGLGWKKGFEDCVKQEKMYGPLGPRI